MTTTIAPIAPIDNDDGPETCDCNACGTTVAADDAYDVNGDLHCGDCVTSCDRSSCGDVVLTDDTTSVVVRRGRYSSETQTWCQSCVDDHTTECAHCNDVVPDDETTTVGSDEWCQTCYVEHASTCEECNDTVPTDDSRYHDGRTWCAYCYENRVDDDDDDDAEGHGDTRIGGYRATAERGYTPARSESLAEYGFSRRIPRGRIRDGAILFFGLEWELETVRGVSRGTVAATARRLLGAACAGVDHDGSLTDGCEAITQPLTLTGHRAAWGPVDATPMRGVARAHDPNTCGLHVHATRDAASDLTWAKVAQVLGGARDAAFWSVFCRRGNGEYVKRIHNKRPADIGAGSGSHYDALSFLPTKTVEWRQPRGTVVIGTILGTIETYHSVIRYCAQAGWRDVVGLGADGWIAWLQATPWARRDAKHAIAYMRRLGLLPVDRRHPVAQPTEDESPGPYGPSEPTVDVAPHHPLLQLVPDLHAYCPSDGDGMHRPSHRDPIRMVQDVPEIRMRDARNELTAYIDRSDPRFVTYAGPVRPAPDLTPDHPSVIAALHDTFRHVENGWYGPCVVVGDLQHTVQHEPELCAVWAVANAMVRLLQTAPCRPVVALRRARRPRAPTDPRAARRRALAPPKVYTWIGDDGRMRKSLHDVTSFTAIPIGGVWAVSDDGEGRSGMWTTYGNVAIHGTMWQGHATDQTLIAALQVTPSARW